MQGGPEALRDRLRRETETWGRVIREADIRPE
jgi:hypothetical protein